MATVHKTEAFVSPAGKRYIQVTFTPQVADPAREESVVAVYSVRTVEVPMLNQDPYVATFISATRTETRMPYECSDEQREVIEDYVLLQAGNDDGLGWE